MQKDLISVDLTSGLKCSCHFWILIVLYRFKFQQYGGLIRHCKDFLLLTYSVFHSSLCFISSEHHCVSWTGRGHTARPGLHPSRQPLRHLLCGASPADERPQVCQRANRGGEAPHLQLVQVQSNGSDEIVSPGIVEKSVAMTWLPMALEEVTQPMTQFFYPS